MKRLMRLMTARFPEILVIELLDLWILMRLPDRLRLIVAVQYARTRSEERRVGKECAA